MENINFMNLPQAPQPKKQQGDRFIPNRNAMQQNQSQHRIDQQDSPSNYMKEVLFDSSQVLNFQLKEQKLLTTFDILQHSSLIVQKNMKQKQKQRVFPEKPEKILDAPEILNDYYLNLLDWGQNGLLAVCLGNTVYLLLPNGEAVNLMTLSSQADYVGSVSWLDQTNILAIGISNSQIQIYDAQQQSPIRTLKGHESRVGSLSWNGTHLTSGSHDKSIINWDLRQSNPIVSRFEGHQKEVCGLKWSPDHKFLASGGNDNSLMLWDYRSLGQSNPSPLQTMNSHVAAVKVLFQEGFSLVPLAIEYLSERWWPIRLYHEGLGSDGQICSIAFSKQNQEIITAHGSDQNQITIWDFNQLKIQGELLGHTRRVLYVSLNPEEQSLVSAGADETIRFWKYNQQDKKPKKTSKYLTSPCQIR